MKYKSELLFELIENNGHVTSKIPHYESECENEFISEVRGAYPKLNDYSGEWLNYANNHVGVGKFPTERVVDVTNARFENVVPYAYNSAILKGSTKYRDIDTGEILESFEEGRNLELVSVKMPVLTTTGKNLFDKEAFYNDWKSKVESYVYKEIVDNEEVLKVNNFKHLFDDKDGFRINVKKGVPLTVRMECKKAGTNNTNSVFTIRYGDKKYLDFPSCHSDEWVASTITFVPTRDYITFCSGYNYNDYYYVKNIQLEVGSTATPYEPYKSNILTVNEEVELRGIGDVKDELNLLTGEVTERTDEITLDVTNVSVYTSDNSDRFEITSRTLPKNNQYITRDYSGINNWGLTVINNYNYGMKNTISYHANAYKFYIRFESGLYTAESLKQKLIETPLTLVYQLETPTIKTVDLICLDENNKPTKFKPYEGVMYVVTSSETLPPLLDMEVPVEAISQNLTSFIK